MPIVSIFIPAHNVDRTILEVIESVQKQAFSDFEITIINNDSTNRTIEIPQNSIKDNLLKEFFYKNERAVVSSNLGAHATGDFIPL